ncbi:MAG TPA: TetR/AcrR family transcriptional regulator [Casimicrobiaceae bacterium]
MSVAIVRRRGPVRPDARNVVRGQETRRRILESARARILAGGFEALRLDDLARDADVTKAAVIKSVGGKATILLALNDEDRQTRLAVIRQAMTLRTGLRRRISQTVRRLFELDLPRLNVVMAYIGYVWFWTGADHDRAQAMIDETRGLLGELIAVASPRRPVAERLRIIALRVMAGYVIGLRDVCYDRVTAEQAIRFVVDYALD